ncbi:MAG: type I polyketide synthase, partial [Phycisphaerae bacterium]
TAGGTPALRNAGVPPAVEPASASASVPASADRHPAIFDTDRITAFALGKPSDAFGDRYQIFDRDRKIARLPGPPFQFLDRITAIHDCQPWQLAAGGTIEAQYDVPPDAWYFQSRGADASEMPFAVLLEIALQPCGWLAAYLGSALVSPIDMRFRNLGGTAIQLLPVLPDAGTLTTTVKITNVSHSGGMIIQHFDMSVRHRLGEIYRGNTYFGFFSKESLANQVGIRDAAIYQPTAAERACGTSFAYPDNAPFPTRMMRMVDRIDFFDPAGGPKQLGYIRGTTTVDPAAWFFKAHFFEDPVWPGSLGLESFLQLFKVVAHRRWGTNEPESPAHTTFQTLARNQQKHSWIYRGQIIPTDKQVTVEAVITEIDDPRRLIRANGFLTVDGRVIYQMTDFAITMT